MATTIRAERDDRVDRIAYRVYGDVEYDSLRTIMWANRSLPIVIEQGTEVHTPPVSSFPFVGSRAPSYRNIRLDSRGHIIA